MITTALSTSLDGYIAGPNDGPGNLGDDGERLFDWFTAGDTPSRFYERFRMSAPSAKFFDEGAASGGAVIQQAIRAGLLDELVLNLVTVLLGGGVRLLDDLGSDLPELELVRVVDAPGVTHLVYRRTSTT